jgi:hypothetical protein
MKNLWKLMFLAVIVLFMGCSRNETKKWSVQYKTINRGFPVATFRMTYMLRSGATKSVGPITTRHWESEVLDEFEGGRPVQLEIEILSGEGLYELQILRDGAIHERETLSLGDKHLFIESVI